MSEVERHSDVCAKLFHSQNVNYLCHDKSPVHLVHLMVMSWRKKDQRTFRPIENILYD